MLIVRALFHRLNGGWFSKTFLERKAPDSQELTKTLLERRVLDSQELTNRTIKRWGRYPRRFVFYHKILLLDIELLTKAII